MPCARREYHGFETLRRYNLIGSPHHVIRPLGFNREINGVLAVEYYAGEEFSHAIARATQLLSVIHLADEVVVGNVGVDRLIPRHGDWLIGVVTGWAGSP